MSVETSRSLQCRTEADFSDFKYDLNRAGLEDLLKRRFFIAPSFSIYGGVAGLYDFGPPGSALKDNIVRLWRNHFVVYDNMLEVDCTSVTPRVVLEYSGHIAKFCDYMVKDNVTGQCLRADHVLKGYLEKLMADKKCDPAKRDEITSLLARIDDLDMIQLSDELVKWDVRAPETNNLISPPAPFNLMFPTQIGPEGNSEGFLRPETAQGIMVNFQRLLNFNGGRLPFAAAQIGNAFRNEICPRSSLLRVREFAMAEIEYFVEPQKKVHSRFAEVAKMEINLLSCEVQLSGSTKVTKMPIGQAVGEGMIGCEALGYFMGRTFLFMRNCGIPEKHIRFRQHLSSEMAHYAADCWDAEIRTSYGWIEIVGHADRTDYDLRNHTGGSKIPLQAFVPFEDGLPREIEMMTLSPNKPMIGKQYKKDAQPLLQYLVSLDSDGILALKRVLEKGSTIITVNEKEYSLTSDMVRFNNIKKKVMGDNVTPHCIEPSFGIGRLLYCVLEHAYWVRKDSEARGVLSFSPMVAPIKVTVFPLQQDSRFRPISAKIGSMLAMAGISNKVDETTATIGKRYARTDEIGVPFAVTIDYEYFEQEEPTVTLRERDSTAQIRLPVSVLLSTLQSLLDGRKTWQNILEEFPAVVRK